MTIFLDKCRIKIRRREKNVIEDIMKKIKKEKKKDPENITKKVENNTMKKQKNIVISKRKTL